MRRGRSCSRRGARAARGRTGGARAGDRPARRIEGDRARSFRSAPRRAAPDTPRRDRRSTCARCTSPRVSVGRSARAPSPAPHPPRSRSISSAPSPGSRSARDSPSPAAQREAIRQRDHRQGARHHRRTRDRQDHARERDHRRSSSGRGAGSCSPPPPGAPRSGSARRPGSEARTIHRLLEFAPRSMSASSATRSARSTPIS